MKQLFNSWSDDSQFNKSFRMHVALAWLLIGSVLLFFFCISKIVIIKVILLFLGLKLVIFGLLKIFNILIIPLPDIYRTKISKITTDVIMLLYIFFYSHSQIVIIISLILILLLLINEFYKFWKNYFLKKIVERLFVNFSSSESPQLDCPFVYIITTPGLGAFYSHRLATNVIGTLFRSPTDTKGFLFIFLDTVRKYPNDFKNWLISRAATTIMLSATASLDEYDKKTIQKILNLSLGKVILIFCSAKEGTPAINAKQGGVVTISERYILPQ